VHIESLALAEAARELTIDVGRKSAVHPVRGEAIGRAHDVDHGLDEAGVIRA
jgi:hypothetical protein